MTKNRVAVAMSGGVDSSVAAARLLEWGYDVVGITMNLFSLLREFCTDDSLKSCCGRGAIEDANRVASKLGIDHYLLDLKKPFEELVIADFLQEYRQGRTPNPCIRCNQYIKFDVLMKRASKLDANFLATGHHARIEEDKGTGRFQLKKGRDGEKDQSYFLYTMTQEQLSKILFPIGDLTKTEVRAKAEALGLPVAQRPESQEICFIPDNNYVRFLKERIPGAFQTGPIVNEEGKVLGEHNGIIHFTVGQRRGMGISAPHPLYVLDINPHKNRVIVGPDESLYKSHLQAANINWISKADVTGPLPVKARIRYKHREAKAELVMIESGQVHVKFDTPQRAITPGQAVVFYDSEVVVGGGTIQQTQK
ncbi:tRNA 2-thiouridine(34) synthase MnmA [Acidobacteriota bacterium]